jgi:hypothetical protein
MGHVIPSLISWILISSDAQTYVYLIGLAEPQVPLNEWPVIAQSTTSYGLNPSLRLVAVCLQ